MDKSGTLDPVSSSGDDFDKSSLLATPLNMVVLGTDKSCKHRFLATFVGRQLGLNPGDTQMKKLLWLDGTPFMINLDTNICGCWSINDQSFRSGQGFIFVYNTASRPSFDEFTSYRERIMRVKEVERSDKLRQVASSEGKKLSEYFGCLFKEVSQDDPGGVEECVLDMLREVRAYESGYIAKKSSGIDDHEALDDISNLTEFGIAVMGDIFVGKTCLVRKLISNSFHPRYVSTSEDNTQKYRLSVDNKKFILRLIDTPGLLALDSLTKEYLLPMQGFILVYSVTSRESFMKLEDYKRVIYKYKTETKIPIVIVGNKSDDKFGRQVSYEEGKLRARQLGASFFELSSQNDAVEAPFAQCVRDLQGLYEAGPIMADNLGEIEKTGTLQHQQKRKWRPRIFTLKNGMLTYSNVDGGAVKGCLVLTQVSTDLSVHDPKIGFPFDIVCGEEHWMLAAGTAEDRNSWLSAIRLNIAIKEAGDALVNEVLKVMVCEIVSTSGVKPKAGHDINGIFRSEELDIARRHTVMDETRGHPADNMLMGRSLDSIEVTNHKSHTIFGRNTESSPASKSGNSPSSQEKRTFSLRRGLSSLSRKKEEISSVAEPVREAHEAGDLAKAERKAFKRIERKDKKKEKKAAMRS